MEKTSGIDSTGFLASPINQKSSVRTHFEKMRIIIDGYNLMHAVGFAGNLSVPGNLERARHSMLEKLVDYLTDTERKMTLVVFDMGKSQQKQTSRIQLSRNRSCLLNQALTTLTP